MEVSSLLIFAYLQHDSFETKKKAPSLAHSTMEFAVIAPFSQPYAVGFIL